MLLPPLQFPYYRFSTAQPETCMPITRLPALCDILLLTKQGRFASNLGVERLCGLLSAP